MFGLLLRSARALAVLSGMLLCLLYGAHAAAETLTQHATAPANGMFVMTVQSRAQQAHLTLGTQDTTLASRLSRQPFLQREIFLVGPLTSGETITVSLTEQTQGSSVVPALDVSMTLAPARAEKTMASPSAPRNAAADTLNQAALLERMYLHTLEGNYRTALDTTYLYYQEYANKLIFQCHLLSTHLQHSAHDEAFRYELLADIGRSLSELDRMLPGLNSPANGASLNQSLYRQACVPSLSSVFQDVRPIAHTFGDSLLADAKQLLDYALIRSEQTQDTLLQARALYRMWYYYNRTGDTQKAELVVRQALNMLQLTDYQDNELVEMTGSAATTLMELGNYVKAAQILALGNLHSAQVQSIHRETILFSNAFLYRKLGEYEASEQFFFDLLSDYRLPGKAGLDGPCEQRFEPTMTVAQVLTQLGILKNQQAAYQEAESYLRCALQIFPETGIYYRLVAELELTRAQWLASPAVNTLQTLPDKEPLLKAQIPQRVSAQLLKLDVHGSLGDSAARDTAIQNLATLFGHPNFFTPCADGDQQCLLAQESRAYPLKQIEAFRLLISVLQNEATPDLLAYYFARASNVLNHVRGEASIPQAWTEAQYSLVEEYVNALLSKKWMRDSELSATLFALMEDFYSVQLEQEKRLYGAQSGPANTRDKLNLAFRHWMNKEQAALAAPPEDIQNAQREARQARSSFFQHAPPVAHKPQQVAILSLAQVQKKLSEDERLVRFFVGQRHQFALIVSPSNVERFDLSQVDMHAWEHLSDTNIDWRSLVSSSPSNALLPYQKLVKQGVKKLILIPDGHLHRLPFSALAIQAPGQLYQPLGAQFELVRTYSASRYFAPPAPQFHAKDTDIALFAATATTASQQVQMDIADNTQTRVQQWLNTLAPIPGVLTEIDHIETLFSNSRLHKGVGNQATRAFLLSEQARSADLLHIATHGLFNPDVPDIVGLMAYEDEPQTGMGLLTLSELFSQPFDSDLVVISGCNTMMGRNYKGSGMRSLTRGFMAQGARSVMGTLWSVPDAATSRFMQLFYDNLLIHELNIAKALSATKQAFIDHPRYRHPRYWAAFVLTTKNQQFETLPVTSALLAALTPTDTAGGAGH